MLEKTNIGRVISWQELPRSHQRLLREAEKAMARAHCPYSGFSVGAAILASPEKMVSGANYEALVGGDSICAERVALTTANTQGYGKKLRTIAVIARSRDSPTSEVTAPCGSCRQMLTEAAQIADYDLEVIMSTTLRDKIVIAKISELLPFAFGSSNLGTDGGGDQPNLAKLAKAG